MAAPDTTNRKNLLLLVQLRWLAVAGQIITILFVHHMIDVVLPVAPMAAIVLFLVGLNVTTLLRLRSLRPVAHFELFVELLLDVAALTAQLYLSGGASNPFVFLYLLQVMLGATLLDVRATWSLVGFASACFLLLMSFNRPLAIPLYDSETFVTLHVQGSFISFLLTACLLVLFITRINRNLRERDAHLADLRQQAAEEDHIVRIGLLASGAAHELGTPLATLSVILNDWRHMSAFRKDPQLLEEMGEMQVQLDRCKQIVSSILVSSGEARGEGTIRTTMRDFLDDAALEWRASRSPAQVDYSNTFEPDASIVSDAALKQVLFNLFDNALEASPAWVGLSVMRQEDMLVIVVADAGPGFKPDMLQSIGKPYQSSKNRPGSGLGLFLVVNAVRKLGGSVSAQNNPGKGASVTLTLPLATFSGLGSDGKPSFASDR
ncbi:ATP-binding protein [Hyphomicrobium sp. CS1GBMeth3]|uniref:ATP-binding protein n=1 Tax=Hyphomicrobium sp. CS1GBMeth3 TaxID=1892845 RepID=UPI0009319636|nr:ATP-binding protein [Hyphomicrobium sp. CS1GBMeth3]